MGIFGRTLREVKRLVVLVMGLTALAVGIVMLVTPGPGWLVIFAGLGLLSGEFIWARRVLDRLKEEKDRIGASVFGRGDKKKCRQKHSDSGESRASPSTKQVSDKR